MDDEELNNMKYFLAGLSGFVLHAIWIVLGIFWGNQWSFLNIYIFHAKNVENHSILFAGIYALLMSVVFSVVYFLSKLRVNIVERKMLSLWAGLGFYLAFWGLIFFFYLVFSGFGF